MRNADLHRALELIEEIRTIGEEHGSTVQRLEQFDGTARRMANVGAWSYHAHLLQEINENVKA